MQNPPTFPACYPVLFRGRFILKANHSTTNGDIAMRNTTQACGRKGKGEYRNLVTAAVFCIATRQELSHIPGLEKLGGSCFTSLEKATRWDEVRYECETAKKTLLFARARVLIEIKDKTARNPYARETARPLARQYIAMRRKSK